MVGKGSSMSKYYFLLLIIVLFVFGTAVHAQEKSLLATQPESGVGGTAIAWPQDADHIGGITEDSIGLDDTDYKFAPNVTFYSATGKRIHRSKFEAGDYVGYALNDKNEVVSLWKLNK